MTVANQIKSQVTAALDANDTASVTDALDLELAKSVFVSVEAASGAHTAHVLSIQVSADGAAWFLLGGSTTITGLNFLNAIEVSARYMRMKVTTAEGGASTVNVRVQAKA